MVCMNHGSLPTAVLHGRSPLPYTFVTGDLNFLQCFLSKSVVHGPDQFKDALKRPITTIPPSVTTTHHDGGLPFPLSCTLVNNDPPLPSPLYTYSTFKANLRKWHLFQNNSWTKWEVVQLADKLEAKQAMSKTD
jgi:hypothetical protein